MGTMISTAKSRLGMIFAGVVLACGLGGCVTAHEASTTLEVTDFSDSKKLDELFLLMIRCQSVEKQGTWWVVQQEQAGCMVPRSAEVLAVNSGEELQQEGKVIMLWGPYAHGHALGYEYWVFRKGYQPDEFFHSHLEQAAREKKPVKVSLERNLPGEKYSDEHVLDGIRKLVEVADFLSNDSVPARDLMQLACYQLGRIIETSYRGRDKDDAKELLADLEKRLEDFPPAELPKTSTAMGK